MNIQITKQQHQVPQFYLKLWSNDHNRVWQYDLKEGSCVEKGTKGILYGDFYYEEDQQNPDNRIENILSKIESETSTILSGLNQITNRYTKFSQNSNLKCEIEKFITIEKLQTIKKFAAFQYLRIPGAIEQKEYELSTSPLQRSEIDYCLNPGRFVESGYNYIKEHFLSLNAFIHYSFNTEFLTSDWPCFDLKDSYYAPLLGEEIGQSNAVIACLVIVPRLRLLLYPSNYGLSSGSLVIPSLVVSDTSESDVKNQNNLAIQQSIRYVISRKKEDFIFKVASKRK